MLPDTVLELLLPLHLRPASLSDLRDEWTPGTAEAESQTPQLPLRVGEP